MRRSMGSYISQGQGNDGSQVASGRPRASATSLGQAAAGHRRIDGTRGSSDQKSLPLLDGCCCGALAFDLFSQIPASVQAE